MAIKMIDGIKCYPAFRTETHAHDIEYRRNKVMNELDDAHYGMCEITPEYEEYLEGLEEKLTDILMRISFPITYLPWELYQIARETIGWAGEARSSRR